MNKNIEEMIESINDEATILKLANKYSTHEEFAKKEPDYYEAAVRKGETFFNQACSHMARISKEEILQILKGSRNHGVSYTESVLNSYNELSNQKSISKNTSKKDCSDIEIEEGIFTNAGYVRSHKPKNQKIIPKDTSKKYIVEFLQQEDSTGKYSERIREYSNKNRAQVKMINQSHDNFVSVMGDKMSSTELTYVRFKQIVDDAVKAMKDKNQQSTGVLKTLVVMDNAKFSDDAVYENNFKLLDDNFSENERNVSVVFDITLKLSQMKNKNALVDHAGAMDELTSLQKNIDGYLK